MTGPEFNPADEHQPTQEEYEAAMQLQGNTEAAAPDPFADLGDLSECHADGCARQISDDHLMCKKHWSMVPVKIRYETMRYLRAARLNPLDANNTQNYIRMAKTAIMLVKRQEHPEKERTMSIRGRGGWMMEISLIDHTIRALKK